MIAAAGSACPVPAMSGAEPCTGSNIDGPVRAGLRLAEAAEPDPAGDRAAEVGEDVAEQVVGDDHVVAARVLHEVDARGVDVVVRGRDVGVLGGDLVERALPQVAGEGEHVGLVHEREVAPAARLLSGQLEREADAALDAHPRVDRALRGDLVRRALAQEPALAGVDALGVLADDDEVDAALSRLGPARTGAGSRRGRARSAGGGAGPAR